MSSVVCPEAVEHLVLFLTRLHCMPQYLPMKPIHKRVEKASLGKFDDDCEYSSINYPIGRRRSVPPALGRDIRPDFTVDSTIDFTIDSTVQHHRMTEAVDRARNSRNRVPSRTKLELLATLLEVVTKPCIQSEER